MLASTSSTSSFSLLSPSLILSCLSSPSHSLHIYLAVIICVSLCPHFYVAVSLSPSLSFPTFLHLCWSLFLHLCIFICPYLSLFLYPHFWLSTLPLKPHFLVSIFLSSSLCLHFSACSSVPISVFICFLKKKKIFSVSLSPSLCLFLQSLWMI